MKNISLPHTLVLIFAVITLCVTCKKKEVAPTTLTPGTDVLYPGVVVIDTTKQILNRDTALINAGIYKYTYTGSIPNIAVSSILIGQQGSGYLRQVNSMKIDGNTITCTTQQASLDQVFRNTSFAFNMDMNNLKQGRLASDGLSFSLKDFEMFKRSSIDIKLLSGSINFNPNWKFNLKFDGTRLSAFDLATEAGKMTGNLNFYVTAEQAAALIDTTFRLATYTSAPKVVFVPAGIFYIPVVVTLRADVLLQFSVELNGSVTREFTYNADNTLDMGVHYADGSWTNNFKLNAHNTLTKGKFSGTTGIKLKASLSPKVTFVFYGIDGPYATLGLKEQMAGNIGTPSPFFDFLDWDFRNDVWMNALAGVKGTVLSKYNFSYEKEWNSDSLSYITPFKVIEVSGNNQTAVLQHKLRDSVRVRVVDSKGLPEKNVPVYFSVIAGDSVEFIKINNYNNTCALTDKDGYAACAWVLGAYPGRKQLNSSIKRASYYSPKQPQQVNFEAYGTDSLLYILTNNSSKAWVWQTVTGFCNNENRINPPGIMGNTMTFSPYSGGQYKNGIDTLGYYKNEVYERYIQVHIDEGSLRCRDDFDSLPCYNHLGTVTSLSYYIRQCRDWGCTPADFRTYFSRRNNGTGELDFIEYTNITENRIVGKDGDNWSCIGQDLRSYGSDAILIPK